MEVTKEIQALKQAVGAAFDQDKAVEVDIVISAKGRELPARLRKQGWLATPKGRWLATLRISSQTEHTEFLSVLDQVEAALAAA